MRIGELAKRSEVTVRTVRYYVEEGLLPQPPRRGKYSDFDDSYIQRIKLIQRMKHERLSLPEIRGRLAEMGLVSPPPSPQLPLPFPAQGEAGTGTGSEPAPERREGIFRSRFAVEAGMTTQQTERLESMGVVQSSEGLFPADALPVAQAAAQLFARGATVEDVADIVEGIRQEAALHRRLLERADPANTLARALQWQEQTGAVNTLRRILIRQWSRPAGEDSP